MFGIILIAVATLMHVYVFQRAGTIPSVKERIPPRILAGTGLVLWGIVVLGRFYGHGAVGAVPAAIESIGMTWLATVFLLAVFLLAADLVSGFGYLLPRLSPALRTSALIAGGAVAAFALCQGMRLPAVEDYEVRLPGLPRELDGTVIAAMSDLHLGPLQDGRRLSERVEQINALRPDLVVLLGDMFEGHGPPPPEFGTILGNLSAPMGVWAVFGNHESHGEDGSASAPFEKAGIEVLRNRWVQVRPGLVLAGVEYLGAGRRPGKDGDSIDRALSGRPGGACILLSHAPGFPDKAASAGADLMLCGHTHGGQIWPLGYLTRLVFPMLDGEYAVGNMKVIVSRGAGTWGPRMRLWRRSQVLRITCRSR